MSVTQEMFDDIDALFGDTKMSNVLKTADKEIKQMETSEKQTTEEQTSEVQACKADEQAEQTELFPECASKPKKTSKAKKSSTACSTPPKPKEPEKDMERHVVLTNYNEQRNFPAEMTLEEIRVELENEYPAYSKENTSWYFEKQEDKNRYLCIPNYKSNKAG